MAFAWSTLTDEDAFHALETQPVVYGPYHPQGDGEYLRRRACSRIVVGVSRRRDGAWIANFVADAYPTAEAAMEELDAYLCKCGARLVGPSKVPA
jgi:hypothetical protein